MSITQIKKYVCALLVLAPALMSCTEDTNSHVQINTSVAKDATRAVWEALHAATPTQNTTIEFAPGTYHFYPDKAQEKYLHISNHDDDLTRIAFPIEKFKGLTIEGNGAKFIMHGVIIPFLVEESSDVTIKDLTIDWHMPFHSQGTVVAVDKKKKSFDVQFSADYPYEIRDGKAIFIKEHYTHDVNQAILFDPETRGPLFRTELMTPIAYNDMKATKYMPNKSLINYPYPIDKQETMFRDMGRTLRTPIVEVTPGVLRFSKHKKELPPVGAIFVCKGRQDYNRVAPAMRFVSTKNIHVKNVTINAAGGMGILGENCENITIDKVTITPSGDRIISTSADATHFVGCRGHIHLNNCLFENQLDDALNVHGTYQIVQDLFKDNKVGARMGHFQQLGFILAQPGDTIGFVRIHESFAPYATAVIKKITPINGRYQEIEFTAPLPEEVAEGDLMENITAYPTLTVENSRFQHNRARGLLLSTPKKTIVRNNYFETEMDGILMPVEDGKWYESGSANDVLIEGNTFKNCVTMGKNRGVIRFATDGDNEAIAFRNITIKNNTFDHYDSFILETTNVDGLLFENNTILSNDVYPAIFPESPAIRVHKSKNVILKDNTFKGKAKVLVDDVKNNKAYTSFETYMQANK